MIHIKERYEDKVGYDRNSENSFDYRDNGDRDHFDSRQNYYAKSSRVTDDDMYRRSYEEVSNSNRVLDDHRMNKNAGYNSKDRNERNDRYVDTCSGYDNDGSPQFQPIEIADLASDKSMIPSKNSKKAKASNKMSRKSKLCVAVYFCLVSLIVVMLLVNAIPSVGAQAAATPDVIVSNEGYESAMDSILNSENAAIVPPYNYDTTTNWFDSFCDYIGGLFS